MNPTNYTGAPGYPGAGPGQQQQQQQPYTTTGEPTGDAEAGRGGLGAQGAGYQRKEGAEGGGKPGAGFGGGAAGAGSPAQGQMPYGMNQTNQAGHPTTTAEYYDQVMNSPPPALGIPAVQSMINNPR
ncbi:MAG: hypothetical protein WDW36_004704 [Sanguina aurantia]